MQDRCLEKGKPSHIKPDEALIKRVMKLEMALMMIVHQMGADDRYPKVMLDLVEKLLTSGEK